MPNTNPRGYRKRRYKKVWIPWSKYNKHNLNLCHNIVMFGKHFSILDKPTKGRQFPLSKMVVLLMLKFLLGVSYRTMVSLVKEFSLHRKLGLKRPPCFKTIQNTMNYLTPEIILELNKKLIPNHSMLAGVDSSGMKTTRKGCWVLVRFHKNQCKREFRKLHILVDLHIKKILFVSLTEGSERDSPQLLKMLKETEWIKIDILVGDGGYDSKAVFNELNDRKITAGIPVRKGSTTRSRGSPARRKAVIEQKEDLVGWKKRTRYNMRCVVEAIFSGMKRRMGEFLHSIKGKYQEVEVWLKSILWNLMIYQKGMDVS